MQCQLALNDYANFAFRSRCLRVLEPGVQEAGPRNLVGCRQARVRFRQPRKAARIFRTEAGFSPATDWRQRHVRADTRTRLSCVRPEFGLNGSEMKDKEPMFCGFATSRPIASGSKLSLSELHTATKGGRVGPSVLPGAGILRASFHLGRYPLLV